MSRERAKTTDTSSIPKSIIENPRLQDPLLFAIRHLSVKDILALSQTCKQMWKLCSVKQLWLHVLHRDVMEENLLYPAVMKSLDLLSDSETKTVVIHKLRQHHSMALFSSRTLLQSVPFYQPQPVTWLRLIGGTWLLVATADSSSSTLLLFSVESLWSSQTRRPTAQAFLQGPVDNGLVDVSSDDGLIIALELRSPSSILEILSVRLQHESPAFVRLARYNGMSHLRAIQGSSIGFSLHNELSVPSILDWKTGEILHLQARPDVQGGTIAMDFSGDRIALVTPQELRIMQRSSTTSIEGHAQYTTTAVLEICLPVSQAFADIGDDIPLPVSQASVNFEDDGHSTRVHVCASDSRGIYVYSMQMDADTLSKTSLEPFLVWSREYQADDPAGAFRFTSQLLFDKASKTVSWLETLSELCPERGPVRFMTTTRSVSSLAAAKTPPKNTICSSLSGSSGPALYALSVRDFDCGLGLHVVGNMLGELAVYSFAGDSVHKVLPLLRSIDIPRWSGEDFLPKSPVPSFPPRQFIWDEPGIVLNSGEQAYQELWDAHWPSELAVPDTWRRASPFRDFDSYCYCDCIGSPAWELETASPFLGRPIPLLVCETPDEVALIKAGGLFLLHELVETRSALSLFWLLDPNLTLNEIVPLLTDHWHETILGHKIVETFSPNESGMEEIELVRRIQRWEVRHGIVRWKEFKERGGEVEDYWIDGRNRLDDSDVWCEKARKSTTWTCPCSDHLLKRS